MGGGQERGGKPPPETHRKAAIVIRVKIFPDLICYLFKQKSKPYAQLACIHNIYAMQETCHFLRRLI